MSTVTIPSPAEAVQASLATSTAGESDTNSTETAQIIADAKAADTAKAAVKSEPEPKVEDKREIKSLSQSIESDEAPVVEVKTPAVDEPKEGEKPAAFIKRLKQERADALAQLEQLKSKANQRTEATPDEIAALRKEIAERDELLESTAFEKSRKFQEQFAKPLAKAETAAKDLIAKFTETKGVFDQAKALDGKDRLEFLKEHVGDAAGTVFDRMARMDEIAGDRDAALKDRETINKTLATERETQTGTEVLKAFDAQRDDISKKLSVYRGDDSDALVAQAKSLLTGEASDADVISAAYLAVAAPRYIAEVKTLKSENATLKARIKEYEGDKPDIGGRGGDTSDASKGYFKDGIPMSVGEVLKMQLNH